MNSPGSPLQPAPEALAGKRPLYLKREDVHELGSFKWRGALATLEEYRSKGARRVVTASTGNHGAATSWAAARLGLEAVVFVPRGSSRSKLDLIEKHGAQVLFAGRDLDEAKDQGKAFARSERIPFFEDGAEPAQYRGYRTIATEILEQCPQRPGAIVVPVGNGALAGGIGLLLQERAVECLLIGVVAREAPVMALSFEQGHAVSCERMATFADGLAVRVAIPSAVEILHRVVSRFTSVSEREIARAVGLYASIGIRAEGAAAAPLAALAQIEAPGPIVLVVTGRNIDEAVWRRAIETPESFPA